MILDLEWIARSEAETLAATARAIGRVRNSALIRELGDGYLIALGPGCYVNRAVGVGPQLSEPDIEIIEEFFGSAGLPASVQVGSLANAGTLDRLAAHGFIVTGLRWVMAAPVDGAHGDDHGPAQVREVDDSSVESWMRVLAAANGAGRGEPRRISDEYAKAAHAVAGSVDLVASVDGSAVAAGSIEFSGGIAWLGGAATMPAYRGRGLQRQLLGHRIGVARTRDARLVAATAEPGTTSARNLARAGLSLADVQVFMTRLSGSPPRL